MSKTKQEEKPDEIEQLKTELEDWKGKYLRALADYQNLEKRVASQRSEDIQYAGRSIITKLLPILDVLEKVEKHLSDQGLSLVVKQLQDMLAGEHVEKIETLGKPFDPHAMECIEVVAGDNDDTVTEELEPGYTMHDQVIRVAKVKVGKKDKVN